ncbi:MAG: OmpA family protein [Bryobacteraceae bacterium]
MQRTGALAKRPVFALGLTLGLALFGAGCTKKAPAPPPPPTAAAPAPAPDNGAPARPRINSFTGEPRSIERGQSATLRWSVANATDITIEPGLGAVQANGSRQVFPNATTTYTLTANGPGGTDTRTATIEVAAAAAPPPPSAPKGPTITGTDMLSRDGQDAYFDYDKSDIREDARAALTRDADVLKQIFGMDAQFTVVIEGHCDERGSAEYNLGLGDRRATAAKEFLVQLGVPADRLKTISYGKERPQCTDANEACYQKNRRAHLTAAQ